VRKGSLRFKVGDETGLERNPRLLTKSQFAESWQISYRTVTNLVRVLGDSPGIIRFGRTIRIDREVFLDTITRQHGLMRGTRGVKAA
jgi:hypothetical protein